MLHTVCRLLDDASIPYVLEAGTLLGVVREQRLLPWDTDVDITVTGEHVDALLALRHRIWGAGYRTRVRRHRSAVGPCEPDAPRVLKVQTRRWLLFKDQGLMDIFVKYRADDRYHWVIGDRDPVWKQAPAHFYARTTRRVFDGYAFSVPEDSEGYLAYHYGPDWRTPVTTWDFRFDDHCVKVRL
jgi:phosphorylcholine metabolism protein LicD